jgi:hypothetical protein
MLCSLGLGQPRRRSDRMEGVVLMLLQSDEHGKGRGILLVQHRIDDRVFIDDLSSRGRFHDYLTATL